MFTKKGQCSSGHCNWKAAGTAVMAARRGDTQIRLVLVSIHLVKALILDEDADLYQICCPKMTKCRGSAMGRAVVLCYSGLCVLK